MSRRVSLAAEARAQAYAADDWWQRNRRAAPNAFWDEFIAALRQLTEAPESGTLFPLAGVPNLRRILLPTTEHHLYYVATARTIKVFAVWGARRGRPPRIGPARARKRK